jgi:RNA polymerase sigma factor (sigma-70 family)
VRVSVDLAEHQIQLEDLARRYEHRVGFFASKVQRTYMLGSRWDDDLVSAGYWGLFKALKNRRPDAHEKELSAYVSKRIHGAVMDAARTCITQVMRREFSVGTPGEEDRDEDGSSPNWETLAACSDAADPEQTTAKTWQETAIREALMKLDSAERRVIMAYMDGASMSEIAREEGVAVGTMQGRFQRLARMLRSKHPELRRILLDLDV